MPIYDYECAACGHRFELRQGFDAAAQQPCPQCNSTAQRRFHATAIIFKGSGWYVTDYASKSPTSTPAEDGAAATDGHGHGHAHDHHHGHGHDHGHSHDHGGAKAEAKSAAGATEGS